MELKKLMEHISIIPAKFHECFINWMRDCHSSNDKDVIAIDGKHSGNLMTRVVARE